MVKGLDVFQSHFATHQGQYVLIGGTAAALAMEEGGLDFRATKDLDIVLHAEALTTSFVQAFWEFVKAGAYGIRESSSGKPTFYRFQKPQTFAFPAMLELFCRVPDGIDMTEGMTLTPIPAEEGVSSLSAILLDDDYYTFIMEGRRDSQGLTWVGHGRLIPLKACAWLDLTERKARGESGDSKNIAKHAKDVIRLSQLLTAEERIALPGNISSDLRRFLDAIGKDPSIEPKTLQIDIPKDEVIQRIALTYGL